MTTIQLRRGTGQQWRDADPVLASGEPGWDLDTATLKIGDGERPWSQLESVHLAETRDTVALAVRRSVVPVHRGPHLSAWDALTVRSASEAARMIFLGSSTTYGNNATTPTARYVDQVVLRAQAEHPAPGGEEAPVRPLSAALGTPRTRPGIEGINASTGGVTSEQYCPGITLYAAQQLRVGFAVHMVGSNDSVAGMPVSDYRANVLAAVEGLASRGVHGQLLVHTFRRHGVSWEQWTKYGDALVDVAAQVEGVGVLDVSGLFEHLDLLGSDPLDLLDTDAVHMTDAGHRLMGTQIARSLGVTAAPRTAERPDPGTVPVGSVHMDANSGRPLFANGSTWVDADGLVQ